VVEAKLKYYETHSKKVYTYICVKDEEIEFYELRWYHGETRPLLIGFLFLKERGIK